MAGLNDNVREASQRLTRGRCHWARAVAKLSFVALSEAKGRSSEAEILLCAHKERDIGRVLYVLQPFLCTYCASAEGVSFGLAGYSLEIGFPQLLREFSKQIQSDTCPHGRAEGRCPLRLGWLPSRLHPDLSSVEEFRRWTVHPANIQYACEYCHETEKKRDFRYTRWIQI